MMRHMNLLGLCFCLFVIFVIGVAQDENHLCVSMNVDIASGLFTNSTFRPTPLPNSSTSNQQSPSSSQYDRCILRSPSKVPEIASKTPVARNTLLLTFLAIQQALSHRRCSPNNPSTDANAEHLQATLCSMPPRRPHSATEWTRLEAMARRHAPVFRLAENEEYFPLDPHQFALNSDLIIGDNTFYPHIAHGNSSAVPFLQSLTTSALPGGAASSTANSGMKTSVDKNKHSPVDDSMKPFFRLRDSSLLRGASPVNNKLNVPMFADILIRDQAAIATIQYYMFFPFNADNHMDLHLTVANTGKDTKSQNSGFSATISLSSLLPLSPIGEHEGDWQTVDIHIDMLTDQILGVTSWSFGNNEALKTDGGDTVLLSWLHKQPFTGRFYSREQLTFIDEEKQTTPTLKSSENTPESGKEQNPAAPPSTSTPAIAEKTDAPSLSGSRLQLFLAHHTHTVYPSIGSHTLYTSELKCGAEADIDEPTRKREYVALLSHLTGLFSQDGATTTNTGSETGNPSSEGAKTDATTATTATAAESGSMADVALRLTAALSDTTSLGPIWDAKKAFFWRSPAFLASNYHATTKISLKSDSNLGMDILNSGISGSSGSSSPGTWYRDWFEAVFGEVAHGVTHWTSAVNIGSANVANIAKLLQVYQQYMEYQQQISGKNHWDLIQLHPMWRLLNQINANSTTTASTPPSSTSTSASSSSSSIPVPSLLPEVPWAPWWAVLPIKWGEDGSVQRSDTRTQNMGLSGNFGGKNVLPTKIPGVCSKRSLKKQTAKLSSRIATALPFLKQTNTHAVSALFLAWICGERNPYRQLDEFTDPGLGVFGPLSMVQYVSEYAENAVDAPENDITDFILRTLLSSAEITSSVQDLYAFATHNKKKNHCGIGTFDAKTRQTENSGIQRLLTVANFRDNAIQVDSSDVLSLSPSQSSQSLQKIKASIQKSIKDSENRLHQIKAKITAAQKDLGFLETSHRDLRMSVTSLQASIQQLAEEKQSLLNTRERKKGEEREMRRMAVSAVTSAISDADRAEARRLRSVADSIAREITTLKANADANDVSIVNKKKELKEVKRNITMKDKEIAAINQKILQLQRDQHLAQRMAQMSTTALARTSTKLHAAISAEAKVEKTKKILYSELQREQRHVQEVRQASEQEWKEKQRLTLENIAKSKTDEAKRKLNDELQVAKAALAAATATRDAAKQALNVAKAKSAEIDKTYESMHSSTDVANAGNHEDAQIEKIQKAIVDAQMQVGEASITLEHEEEVVAAANKKIAEIEGNIMDLEGNNIDKRLEWYLERQRAVWNEEYAQEDKKAEMSLQVKLDVARNEVYAQTNKDLNTHAALMKNMENAEMNAFLLQASLSDSELEAASLEKTRMKLESQWKEEEAEMNVLKNSVEQALKKANEDKAQREKHEQEFNSLKLKQKTLREERETLQSQVSRAALNDAPLSFYSDYKEKKEKLLEKKKDMKTPDAPVVDVKERKRRITQITEELRSIQKILTKSTQELPIIREDEKSSMKYYKGIQEKLERSQNHADMLQAQLKDIVLQKEQLTKKITEDRDVLAKLKNKILILKSKRDEVVSGS